MTSRARIALISALAAGALCGLAPPAQADHHFISVREIYAGTMANPDSDFLELQMYAPGQNFVNGKSVRVHAADSSTLTDHTFLSDLGNGADQSTILLASTAAVTQFGMDPEILLNPNEIDPAGGAVCWDNGMLHIDCVTWGTFAFSATLGAGTPEAAIPSGSSIVRSAVAGCPTALDAVDDTNDSAADFAPAAPTPRPNALAPVGTPCPPATTPTTSKPKRKKKCKKGRKLKKGKCVKKERKKK